METPVKPKHPLRQWVEKRWPVSPVLRWGSMEQIPGGTRFAYVLGSATLVLFGVLVITGVWQLFYYVPTVDHAYDSVMFLRLQVPLGWLVHGLHYWAAQAFIVVMGLHVARVFIWAAYKKPRELTWVLGVVLLLLGAAFIFTGAILPWDMLGYWAGEVGTSMAGTVPLVGNFLKLLMRGGDTMGQMTLSRAFAVHVAILPALTALFIIGHLVAFRQFGSVGPWKSKTAEAAGQPQELKTSGAFWPDQTFKDLLVVGVIVLVLVCLSAFVRAPITGPADPLDSSYTPKPEWNFLFLYEALKAFSASWEWIGTVVIPAVLVLLLFAVPFIDRNEKRNPFRRPVAMLCGCLFVTVIVVLTCMGYYSKPGGNAPATSASTNSAATASAAPTNVPPSASAASAPTNQVAGLKTAAATNSVAPATKPPVSANAAASAATTSTPTNQPVASPAAPTPTAVAPAPTNQVATADKAAESTNQSPTYLRDVQPILAASCARCHNPQSQIHNWLDYQSTFADRWEIRRRVWDSVKGRYYKEAMPLPGSPEALAFTEAQRVTIRDWVNNGAVLGVAPAPAPAALTPTNSATPAAGPTSASAAVGDVQSGKGLFSSLGCVACHKIDGQGGGVAGPDLSNEAKLGHSSQWVMTQITDPHKHVPTSIMPAHATLTPAQLKSLADYILKPSASAAPASAGGSTNGPTDDSATDSPDTSATVVKMIGDSKHGAVLFAQECAKCHGADGVGHVPNPGSQAGTVPALAPIARGLFNADPAVFAANIDKIIQNGAVSAGPGPTLQMPAFGTTHSLTLPEIANIEAYVLFLNGVDAAKIIHPGITPGHFVVGTAALFILALLAIGALWVHSRTSAPVQVGGLPTPEEFQTLKHEVADLKHKLEERQTTNPKDNSGSLDSQP